ncbi:MAG: homocysteine S-methyltransferase family protein [Anaerolineaceae bacterium]|nr:homocysteine S-methyltransferase family protein [Anaerolineaceae bacterium]
MAKSLFLERLAAGKPLVLDGATGTNLQTRGLPVGTPSDFWVMDNPEAVLALHRDFVEAGSDLILTNTFGSSRVHLGHAGLAERFEETNRLAVALARQAAETAGVMVGGSLGPLGEMVEPLGSLAEADAQAEYAAQAHLLAENGVDVLVIETQFDLIEARAALRGVRFATDLPVVVSFSYDRGTRTMMGVKPAQMVQVFSELGVAAVGINCGRSVEENFKVLQEVRALTDLPVWFKPNAGLPLTNPDGSLYYSVTPDLMGEQARSWLAAGANLVGGCCGTSPSHLRAIAQVVKGQ